MSKYLGDYAEDATLYTKFTTVDSGGAAVTLADTPDFRVYKDDSTTQTDAGITLTTDFDSITGLHHITIDLSSSAFYETGADYQIVLDAGTADGTSVAGYVIADFSIENRSTTANVTQWNGTAVATPATAGYPAVTLKVGTGTGEVNLSSGKAPATIAAGDLATDSLTADALAADAIAEINATVDTALADIHLDHLLAVAIDWSAVHDDSALAAIVSSSDPEDFDRTTDSLEVIGAATGNITAATTVTVNNTITDGGVLVAVQGHTFSYTVTAPASTWGDLTGYTGELGITKSSSAGSGTSALEVTASVANANTESQSFTFSWTAAQTDAMAVSPGGVHPFRVNAETYYAYTFTASARDGGSPVDCPVFARGYVDVLASDTDCAA